MLPINIPDRNPAENKVTFLLNDVSVFCLYNSL